MPHALILDDIAANRRLYARVFRRTGIVCAQAGLNREALAILETASDTPAFILQDYNRPEADGGDFIESLQGAPIDQAIGGLRVRAIPILVLSAQPDRERLAALNPAIPILDKPVNTQELFQNITGLLGDHLARWVQELSDIGLSFDRAAGTISGPAHIDTPSFCGARAVIEQTLAQVQDAQDRLTAESTGVNSRV